MHFISTDQFNAWFLTVEEGSADLLTPFNPVVDYLHLRNFCHETAFLIAAKNGHSDLIQWMLQQEEPSILLSQKDQEGNTALSLAAYQGHFDLLKLLLQYGSPVNQKNLNHQTPLMMAARCGHLDVIRLFLEAGADLQAKDLWGNTAHFYAFNNQHHSGIATQQFFKTIEQASKDHQILSEIIQPISSDDSPQPSKPTHRL